MRSDRQLRLRDILRYDARYFPSKIAMRIDGRDIVYGELERRVGETSRVLRAFVGPGECAGLWLQNSFAWLVCFLALDEIGAVTVPISTHLTTSECNTILEDSNAKLLVTTRYYRQREYLSEAMELDLWEGASLAVVEASDDCEALEWPVIVRGRTYEPGTNDTGDDVLCIQYTSGTTARPKGVVLTNQAYIQTASFVTRCQRLTPSSRFISGAPFFHCSGTMHAITVCLLAGCTLHSLSRWDPERFLDETERNGCEVAHMIFFRDVLALGAPNAREKLRTLRVAHELGTAGHLMRVHDELGVEGISNLYGMTETAGQFTMWFPDDPLEKRVGMNGRPQPGNDVRIVSPETGLPVGSEEIGEIQMRGATLSKGYFRRPEATAAAFTADGWLRSGDLGALSEAGELRYIARLKEIIRVGGENLAPAEVEQAIRDLTGIQQLCVLGIPDERLEEVPALVVVGSSQINWPTVIESLRRKLAGFKIPRAVYSADVLPMTPTNRVQRSQLQASIAQGKLVKIV